MTAEIWNTYELAIAATTGGLIVGVATVGLMVLKRLDGAREVATAKGWWEKAIKVQEANDRARWAPVYSGNLFAIEADKPHDAEVLDVTFPTQEMRLADGLDRLRDEVGLAQALDDPAEHKPNCPDLFYCPTVGEVESGCHGGFDVCCWAPELHQPVTESGVKQALSAESHEDEQAPAEDTDRPNLAGVIATINLFGWRWTLRNWWGSLSWVERWADFRESRRTRDQVGSGQPSDDEPWVLYDEDELRAQGVSEEELKMLRDGSASVPYDEATDAEARLLEVEAHRAAKGSGIRQVLAASGHELDPAPHAFVVGPIVGVCGTCDTHVDEGFHTAYEDELDVQRAEWVALNPPAVGPDGQRHWNGTTAMHELVVTGRHRKMPINPVPAQRTGNADA